jgi:hypothetical protein
LLACLPPFLFSEDSEEYCDLRGYWTPPWTPVLERQAKRCERRGRDGRQILVRLRSLDAGSLLGLDDDRIEFGVAMERLQVWITGDPARRVAELEFTP